MPIFSLIGAAIAGAIGLAGTAFTVVSGLIAAGLALGAKLALSYLTRPKKKPYSAVQGEVQFGGDVYRQVVVGKSKTKGHMIYYAYWGAGDKYNAEVRQLSDGRCDGIEPEIYFYGQKHTLVAQSVTGNEHARYFVDGFGSKLEIRFYDGRPGQLADAQLVSATSGYGNPWKATSKCVNGCYVVWQYEYDSALFDKGIPDPEFVLRGVRQYDPRYDSTVPGGSGAQRLANPATWVWTQNPAIHRLNYLLGLKGVLSGRTMIGVGMDLAQIDVASHMVAATVCDTTRTVGARTIPTYAASLIVQGDDDHIEILAEFEDAMAGYSANMNGLSGIIAGAPQAVAATLTADDIRVDDVLDVSYRRSGQDSVNILSGQFTSPESLWTPVSLTTVTVNADVTMDGRKRPASNDFLQVTDPDIGQYLLNIRYRQNRKAGKASVPVSRRFGAKTALGDWISWNGKTWLVSGRSFDERMRFRLDLAETGSDIYSEAGITPGPVVIPPSAPQNPSLLSTVAGFSAVVGMLGDVSGTQRPTIQFTWTPPGDPTITQVRFFYRIIGTTEEVEAFSSQPESGIFRTAANVLPNRNYEARATITTVPDRVKTFTAWVNCGTTAVDPALSFGLTNAQNDALDLLDRVTTSISDVRSLIEQVAHDAAAATGMNVIDRRTIKAELGSALAMIETEQAVRATEDDALALQITTLNASYASANAAIANEAIARADADTAISATVDSLTTTVDGVSASVSAEAIARSDGDTALAGQITALSASVGDYTAEGLMGWTVQAGGSGVSARFALEGRVNTGSGWVTGGMYMEIMSGGARRVVFDVDNFTIVAASGTEAPFTYDSGLGTVLIKNAYIRNLNATNIAAGSITAALLNADVATFVNAQITSATIEYAQINNVVINEGVIAAGAVTSSGNVTNTYALPSVGVWYTVLSMTIQSPSSNPVRLYYDLTATAGGGVSSNGVQMRLKLNGADIEGSAAWNASVGGGSTTGFTYSKFVMIPVSAPGAQVFTVQVQATGSGTSRNFTGSMVADCNKK